MPIFLANAFLIFCVAAAIPVLLHLLYKRKPVQVRFAAVRFLQAAVEQTRRSRRMVQCLLMILRVLILLLLALAFAQPLVRMGGLLPSGPRTVLIVLDASASMQAQEDGISRFEKACAMARELLNGLQEGDKIGIIAPGLRHPAVIFPPVTGLDEARRVLMELKPEWSRARLLETLESSLKREMADGMEIHIFSDFQTAEMTAAMAPAISEMLKKHQAGLFFNSVRNMDVTNAGIANVQFIPPAIIGDGSFQARTEICCSSQYLGPAQAALILDERSIATANADLQPGSSAPVLLTGTASQAIDGQMECTGIIELGDDSYQLDNRFYFSLPRIEGLPALLVDGGGTGKDTFFLEKVLRPGPHLTTMFAPEVKNWNEFMDCNLADYHLVFVCNPPSMEANIAARLASFAANGGTVVLFPGNNDAIGEEEIHYFRQWTEERLSTKKLDEETMLGIRLETEEDAMGRLVQEKLPQPWPIPFRQFLDIQVPAEAKSVWTINNGGQFALQAEEGEGTIWLMAVSGNRDWSDWPVTPHFLVFMHELMRYAAGRHQEKLTLETGDLLLLKWPGTDLTAQFAVTTPSGENLQVAVERSKPLMPYQFDCFDEVGYYLISDGRTERRIAVNVPASESSQDSLGGSALKELFAASELCYAASDWENLCSNMELFRRGRPLWPLLLVLTLALSFAELFFANWRSRGRR